MRHVQEVLFLPDGTSAAATTTRIKWAVMTYGGVDAAMAFEASGFNAPPAPTTPAAAELDHHVLCVGWDDAYPAGAVPRPAARRRRLPHQEQLGRATRARHGYFWISYYDATFGHDAGGVQRRRVRGQLRRHLPARRARAWSRSIGFGGDDGVVRDRFHSAGSGSVTAVSFYTPMPGSGLRGPRRAVARRVAAAPVAAAGTLTSPGTTPCGSAAPSAVTSGDVFVVAVRLTRRARGRPSPSSSRRAPRSRALPGQSYVSADGASWKDLTDESRLRGAERVSQGVRGRPAGGDDAPPRAGRRTGHRHGPARAHASGSRSRTRRLPRQRRDRAASCETGRGRTLRGLPDPAAPVNERDIWRFAAPRRRGDYVVVARAWDVAGHGSVLTRAALRDRQRGRALYAGALRLCECAQATPGG